HPAGAADLAQPQAPQGVLGLIVAALAARREAGVAPFTVLSCDNLPDNGALLRAGVLGFARRRDPGLGSWIADHVAFPATMVDRITPATTERTLADAEALTGYRDLAAVETEPFSQWVIEDHFPQGRPAWEAGGALFVQDVRPHEAMKLRMLNGSHSLIAYAGQLLGLPHVRD
ncbi:mannitol dehydrogenase family protein, partial [Paracoccus sp. PXZ]